MDTTADERELTRAFIAVFALSFSLSLLLCSTKVQMMRNDKAERNFMYVTRTRIHACACIPARRTIGRADITPSHVFDTCIYRAQLHT